MRYEDASSSFSQAAAGAPDARDDADALAAGSRGPATGNTITGAGTITGTAGADIVTNGPGQIVALEGAGGSDTSEGGSLHVAGRFGELTMDSRGGYTYEPSSESPNGGVDVFRYTLADGAGARDTATLTIEIGRELEEVKADAQQIIPGPDGVVTLPPGVELSDIQVVGRNLVITLPDGSQMVIIDGAVFVPQLVLGGVEVPASNLAALLIDAEPQPAAGTPLSSGGNFAVDVPPLDPGVPLGDLLPPTELSFPEPTFEDVGQFVDREPEIFIQPDGQPASVAAVDSVDEAGLPARPVNEPPGSNAAANSETTTGTILVDSPDGPSVVTINGVAVTAVGQVFAGAFGTLTITSVSDTAIGYSYTLTDNTSGDATHDDFSVTVTDNDGDTATATLTINIIDDVPTARNDTDASVNGVATGNVITDAAPGDIGDTDTNAADTVGADNATLTSVTGFGGSSDSTFSGGFLNVNGQFGSLAIDAQGNYTYTKSPNSGGGGVDVFTYTLTDGDGDTTTATLTITNPDLFPETDPNPVVRTDDDAVPGADGNPGGVDDDVDAENLTGTLSGSGGDGALTFDLLTTGAPAGFTYVDGPGGSVLVQQGGVTVLTITVNAGTGAYTVTQNAPIDHPAGGDENNLIFTINYTVTDVDGDSAPGTLVINVDDDTPTIGREDISAPTLTVDETNLAANATGDFSTLFDVEFGADGPGTTNFAVSVVNGTDSGLVDVATGQSIFLFNNGGVVEGRVGGVGGVVAFTVSVNSTTGVVTLDQIRALEHPDTTDHDEPVSPTATSIQLTATATDGDGDPVNLTINIGGNLVFEDDGPSLTNVVATSGVTLDETTAGSPAGFPISGSSASAVISATQAFGADGPATSGSVVYGLSLAGGVPSIASGLATAIGDHPITLVQIDADTIQGQYNGTNVAFTIQMNADGTITVTQEVPLEHLVDGPPGPAHDDPLDLNDLVEATVTITDGDGDTATAGAAIGDNIVFEDDGPTINVTQSSEGNVVLTTQDAQTIGGASDTDVSTANFSGVFGVTSSGGADGAASVNTDYTLAVANSASGLTSHGVAINLYNIGGVIVGSTSATLAGVNAGNTVFDVSVSGTGVVTLTQYQQVDHALEATTTSPFDDQFTVLADGKITLTASSTITDNDGDTATDSEVIDLGGNIRFADDGPDVSISLNQGAAIRIDETDGVVAAGGEVDPPGGNLGTVTVSAATLFTVTDAHASADSPTTYSYALTLSSQGVNSGLLLSTTNAPIFLYKIGGVVFGSTSATEAGVNAGNTVFTASIDAGTGAVTLTQFFAVEHGNTASVDEDSSPLTAGALNVTVTATDFDGDTDSASADLGSVIRFEDDGPTVDVTASADAGVLVQTQDADTIGAATDTASSSANFGGIFGLTFSGGSDGAATTPTLSYTLGVSAPGVDSGLNQTGADIFLYVIGGKVVGSTSNTQIGVNAGNTVFDVSVSATGVVTLTQYSQIDHPLAGDPTPSGTPFADHIISMADNLVTLTASASITDNDGDTVVDSQTVNIGSNLQFADHGPTAVNDVDTIAPGFFGVATGNVMTGVEVGVPDDANNTDGNADNVGADAPGRISQVSFTPDGGGATVTQVIAPGGSTVIAGDYGVLTIFSNGDYSYDRNDGSAGGVDDVFTYTLTDFDGDTVTATLTINIGVNPPVATIAAATVDDDGLANANPAGTNDINANLGESPVANPSEAIFNGTLGVTGGDGDIDFSLIAPGGTTPVGQETVSYSLVGDVLTATIATSPDPTRVGDPLFTVTLDPETGQYTVTLLDNVLHNDDANNDEDGTEISVSIPYQVVDASGNMSAAPGTLTITFNDDVPSASGGLLTGTVDEDGVVEGADDGGPGDGIAGGTGDVAGEVTVVNGNVSGLFISGADQPLTYSLLTNTAGLPALTSGGVPVTYAVVGNTLTASAGGNTVFTFVVNATTGAYTFTLLDQLDHPTLNGMAGDNTENELTIQLGSIIQATDADGDSVTAEADVDSGLVITVDDDMPQVNAVTDPLNIANTGATPSGTGAFDFGIGADENADNDDISVSGFTVSVNNVAATNVQLVEGSETATHANYTFSFSYPNGDGTTADATGTLVFNKADGTYTVTLTSGPIEGFSILATGSADASAFVSYQSAANPTGSPEITVAQLDTDFFVQFTGVAEPGAGTGANNLFTTQGDAATFTPVSTANFNNLELFTQAEASVTVSSTAAGVAGNTIQGGEVLDFNLYDSDPAGTPGGVPTASATEMFVVLDGIGGSEDMIIVLKLLDTSTGQYTTKALMVQNADIITSNATLAGTAYEGIVLDNNDGIVVIQANDYQEGNTNLVIVGAQIAGSDEGITGTAISFNGALGDTGGSSGTQDFSTDVSDAPFKITSIGFLTDSSEDQSATIEFDVTLEDADGDQVVVQDVTVNIGAVAESSTSTMVVSQESLEDTSSLSLMSSDSLDQQRTMSAANNNSVLLGAIAAAGLGAGSAAAARDFTSAGDDLSFDTMSVGDSGGLVQSNSLDSSEVSRSALGGETKEAVDDSSSAASSPGRPQEAAQNSLTDGGSHGAQAPTALLEGTEAPQSAPADSSFTSASVGMPSAEMLAAANENGVEGAAKSNGEVGRVLADALAGGHGPNIDAALDAMTNQGGQAALEALASRDAGVVSGWDTAGFAGFPGGHSAITMESMVLHPDAVQPAA